MWTEEHESLITEFINDVTKQLLLVYIDEHAGLTVANSVPPFQLEELAYFFREKNARISPENFLEVVQFGTVLGSPVNTILRTMHSLYAPSFFESSGWPDSIF